MVTTAWTAPLAVEASRGARSEPVLSVVVEHSIVSCRSEIICARSARSAGPRGRGAHSFVQRRVADAARARGAALDAP
jgi:hypothetical protein